MGETKLSYRYDDCIPDDYNEEETVCCRSPDASVKRYRDERYKRKVSNIIRSHHHIFCPYGDSHTKRYVLWQAMKSVGWRGHCRRGWNDPIFIKKLQNARVRYTGGTIPKGNQYRKIIRRCVGLWKE